MNYFKEHVHDYNKTAIKEIQKEISLIFEGVYKTDDVSGDANGKDEDLEDEFMSYMFKRGKSNRQPKKFQKHLQFPLSHLKVNTLEY